MPGHKPTTTPATTPPWRLSFGAGCNLSRDCDDCDTGTQRLCGRCYAVVFDALINVPGATLQWTPTTEASDGDEPVS